MNRKQSLKLGTDFRQELVPRRTPGRKVKATTTAAHQDWKAGLRGFDLYRKHITGFDKLAVGNANEVGQPDEADENFEAPTSVTTSTAASG